MSGSTYVWEPQRFFWGVPVWVRRAAANTSASPPHRNGTKSPAPLRIRAQLITCERQNTSTINAKKRLIFLIADFCRKKKAMKKKAFSFAGPASWQAVGMLNTLWIRMHFYFLCALFLASTSHTTFNYLTWISFARIDPFDRDAPTPQKRKKKLLLSLLCKMPHWKNKTKTQPYAS